MSGEHHLARSIEFLQESVVLSKAGLLKGACSRAYYAAFEAARAALFLTGVPLGKTHRGTRAQFYAHFVRDTGRIPTSVAAYLGQTEQWRVASDYSTDAAPSIGQARECVANARAFIAAFALEFFPDVPVTIPDDSADAPPPAPA